MCSTDSGLTPARSTAALMATAPRSLAVTPEKSPWKAPMGVRAAPTITIGSFIFCDLHEEWRPGRRDVGGAAAALGEGGAVVAQAGRWCRTAHSCLLVLIWFRRTVRGRSACGGFRLCRRRFHTAWRRATGGRPDSR